MGTKEDLLDALQTAADAAGDAQIRASLGTPGAAVRVNGETKPTGAAYAVPGFVDLLAGAVGAVVDGALSGGAVDDDEDEDEDESVSSAVFATRTEFVSYLATLAAIATDDRPQYVDFPEGTFTYDGPIDVPSNLIFRAPNGPVRVTRSDAPDVGLADDPTNAVFRMIGTAGALDTTLTAIAYKGAATVTLASVAGLAAEGWLLLSGNNNTLDTPNQSQNDSDGPGVTIYTLAKIESVLGSVVTLSFPLRRHHVVGTRVQAWTPVRNVEIRGDFLIDCAGGSVAAAVHMRGAVNCHVEGDGRPVRVRGFSRAAICVDQGSTEWSIRGVRCLGEVNSIVYAQSPANFAIERITCAPDGARFHANGLIRGLIDVRNRPVGPSISHLQLARGCQGVHIVGGDSVRVSDSIARDMDPTELLARWAAQPALQREWDSDYIGVGFQSQITNLQFVEQLHGLVIDGFQVEDCVLPTTNSRGSAIDLMDVQGFSCTSLQVTNQGVAAAMPAAIRINDASGTITGLRVGGASRQIWITGNAGLINIKGVNLTANAGVGQGSDALYLDNGALPGSVAISIEDVAVQGFGGATFTFGPNWNDYNVELRNLRLDGMLYQKIARAFVAYNNTGTPFNSGELVELTTSPNNTRRITGATAGGIAHGAVIKGASDPTTGPMFVQSLKGHCVLAAAAGIIEPGNNLVVGASRLATTGAGTVIAVSNWHKENAGTQLFSEAA